MNQVTIGAASAGAVAFAALLWAGTPSSVPATQAIAAQAIAAAPTREAKTTTPRMGQRATFRNPLKQNGADPWLEYYNGCYYLSTTTGGEVKLRRARKLGDLATAPDVEVWRDPDGSRNKGVWAAEFHRLDAGAGSGPRWYLYYTAFDGVDDARHRLYVCESAGTDPMGPYVFKAQLQTDPKNEFYAIDATVRKMPDGSLFCFWCGRPSEAGQGLYVARMANPWTITGARTYLPADGFGCPVVREGPETLVHDGKIDLIYSMCGASTPDYRLSMLTANVGDDLLNPASWHQYPKVLFARVDQNGVYGPGHNYFFTSPDGKQDWIAYHAKSSTKDTYADRSARAQPFTWKPGGIPDFPVPAALDTDIPVPSGE